MVEVKLVLVFKMQRNLIFIAT